MNANVLIAKKGHFSFFSERKAAREHAHVSQVQAYIISALFIMICSIYYVWILNNTATKGYDIRTLEVVQRDLLFEDNMADIRIAEAESLGKISSDTSIQDMLPAGQSAFIVSRTAAVALAR